MVAAKAAVLLLFQLLLANAASGALLGTLSAGYLHNCAVTPDTSPPVTCWGSNEAGQLAVPKNLPVPSHLSSGGYYTCAATPKGAGQPLYCWGRNDDFEASPPMFSTPVTQVAAGSFHACALVPQASLPVVCWGNNEFQQVSVPEDLGPTQQVAAGLKHTCAVTPGTSPPVTCWGDNSEDQLAVPASLAGPVTELVAANNYTCAHMPSASPPVVCWGGLNKFNQTVVPRGLAAPAQLAARYTHTCALTPNATKAVTCWGNNLDNQLDIPANLGSPTQVAVGAFHSCAAVTGTTQAVRCWGLSSDATKVPGVKTVALPLQLSSVTLPPAPAPAPASSQSYASGLPILPTLAAGFRHTCALTPDKAAPVTCWGENDFKQVDVPAQLPAMTHLSAGAHFTCGHAPALSPPVLCWGDNSDGQTTVPAISSQVTQVSAGSVHACALSPGGKPSVTCWGWNKFGQTSVPADLAPATQVSAGYRHTCALTPSTKPPVTCWGNNDLGELQVPPSLSNVTQIQASENFTCAVMPGNSPPVTCWGGNSTYKELEVPRDLPLPQQIANRLHTCGVFPGAQPSVRCFGYNGWFQADVPRTLSPATQVALGSRYSCAATPSTVPAVSCWGFGPNQTLVPATLSRIAEPVRLDAKGYPAGTAPAPSTTPSPPSGGGGEVSTVLELRGSGIFSLDTNALLQAVAKSVGATGVSASAVAKEKPAARRRLLAGESLRSLLQSSETGYVTVRLASSNPQALADSLKASNVDLAKPLQAAGLTGVQGVTVVSASPASAPPTTTDGKKSSSIGPIIGGAAGGIVAVVVIGLLGVCLYRRRSARRSARLHQEQKLAEYHSAHPATNVYNTAGSTDTGTSGTYIDSGLTYSVRTDEYNNTQKAVAGTALGALTEYNPRPTKDSAMSSGSANSGPPRSASSSERAASGSYLRGTTTTLNSMGSSAIESSVWIPPGKLKIDRKPDGSEWVLGEGSYGKVYRATLNEVEEVAAKIIKVSSDMQRSVLAAEREVALLKDCLSHYVVRFVGASIEEEQIAVVTEFCHGGDLWHALKRDRTGELRWYNRGRQIALDIARGLHYLHEMKHVIHFDLKSPNVLLDRHGTAKIADVGLSKILRDTTNNTISTAVGTMMWASPEQIMGRQCDYKADIWSLGIIIWEICTGSENPIQARFLRELRVPEECPAEIAQLSNACRNADPALRPTALEVYKTIAALAGGQ